MTSSPAFTRRSLLRGLGAVAGAAGATALVGCSSGGGATPAPAKVADVKPGTLTIMSPSGGEISSASIAAFKKAYPQLKVTVINTDPTRLNAMLAAGDPPDLVRDAGTDVAPYIASQGIALNLDSYFEQSTVIKESDIMPVNDVWKWDGKQQGQGSRYGIAKDWSQDAMWWYNTDVWAAAGLKPLDPDTPVTYDQLLANAKAMTKTAHGKTSMYGLWYVTPNIDYIAGMVATAGGRLISEDLTTFDFSSPEARQALAWIVTAGKEGLGYSMTNPPADWDGPELLASKQATANQGYWFTGYVAATSPAYESKLQFNAAPLLGSTRISPTYGAVGYWIPAKAKNPAAAFAWIEWYCGGDGAKPRIAAGDGLPSLHSLLPLLPQQTAFEKKVVATQENELNYFHVVQVATPYAQSTAIDTTLTKDFPGAITGNMPVGGLADKLRSEVNAVLAAGEQSLGQ
jgi:multiple sugar transport system substrate-binding protein